MRVQDCGLEVIAVGSNNMAADRVFLLDMEIALTSLHGRICDDIGNCGDMMRASVLGAELLVIQAVSENVAVLADKIGDS